MDLMEQIKAMLEDVQKNLQFTGEDGHVIKLADIFKLYPEMQVKYADLAKRVGEMETKALSRASAGLSGLDLEADKFSLSRAIKAIRWGDWKDAGFENEVFQQMRQKAMSAGSDSAGGYLVPTQVMPDVIEMLMANMVCVALGATVIPNLFGSPVEFAKQEGGATAYWVGENAAITPSDLTLGQLTMTPKMVAALVKLSNRLIRLGNPSAEAMVRKDIANVIALALDLAALRGTGANSQPTGIAQTANIATVALGTDGLVLSSFDLFTDMEGKLEDANALKGKLGFAFAPIVRRNAKKLKIAAYANDAAGAPYVPRPVTDQQLADFLGYPFKTTTQIPKNLTKGNSTNCTEVYFGNWEELLIGQWAGIEIMASDQAGNAFAEVQTWVRIIMEVDIGVRHPASFCLCNDLRIAAS